MRTRAADVTESMPEWRLTAGCAAIRPQNALAVRWQAERTRSHDAEGGMDQAPQRTIGASAPESGDNTAGPPEAGENGQEARAAGTPAQPESPVLGSAAALGRWPFHLGLLACYIAAGVAVTWPRASYLTTGRLPGNLDQSTYVWDFWWIAHQVTHLGNPWATAQLAAPVGIQLGFDTLMPLPGLLMTPITLAFGPSVSYN